MRKMVAVTLAWWLLAAGCVWAARVEGHAQCPCSLEPASQTHPGSGEGNLQWNCKDRLLPEVPTSCWTINPNVTQVDLFNNRITTFHEGDFDGLWNLHFLSSFQSHLAVVEAGSLRGLPRLVSLELGLGYLTEVPREVSRLTLLQMLALEYNSISEVPLDRILPLVNLQWLIFVRNHLETIPEMQFLSHLTWLNLEANNIKTLPKGLFGALSLPCQLWINDNPLSDVAAATLLPLPDGSEIRTNASVSIWAQDEEEKTLLLKKHWRVYNKNQDDLDLSAMIHTCDELHRISSDTEHPCGRQTRGEPEGTAI